jgi:hypothetical protein
MWFREEKRSFTAQMGTEKLKRGCQMELGEREVETSS